MEVELNGQTYRIDRMNVFDQWDVARRLMPVLGALTGIKDGDSLSKMLMPAFQSLGSMSNEDSSFVLNKCLSVVKRRQVIDGAVAYANVLGGKNSLMFDDIDMFIMLRLATFVVVENIGDFFSQAALDDSIAAVASLQG